MTGGRGAPRSAGLGDGTAPFQPFLVPMAFPVFMVIVGWSAGGAGTADRSYPHAPQKRSPDSRGSSQLGHFDRAACWGICDINYTHVRGR
ncbi:hypothetical protein GCM10027073_59860 [Streptomyces chlorus]|uniref:Uncharacterized protein n=1 Tax=Streptomyces chlorus TaxID=887452 RepID=A0ABW1DQ95_9ACTN